MAIKMERPYRNLSSARMTRYPLGLIADLADLHHGYLVGFSSANLSEQCWLTCR